MWPNGAVLIREWIEGGALLGECSNAPAAPHIGLKETRDDPSRALTTHDSAPQQVPGVGRDGSHLFLAAIECVSIESSLFAPEEVLEFPLQLGGLLAQSRRELRLGEVVKSVSHPQPCVEGVTLQFAQRLGALHRRTVWIHDGVRGIFPAHVLVALGRSRLIFLQTISVKIAVAVDPFQASCSVMRYRAVASAVP